MKRTKNNGRDPFGISESWDSWEIQIEQLKKRNDLLADAAEMRDKENISGGTLSSSDKQLQ